MNLLRPHKTLTQITNKPRIAIDLDNVLLDSDSNIRQLIFEETYTRPNLDDITDYSYAKSLNLDSATMKRVLNRFHWHTNLPSLEPILGAQNAVSILKLEYEPIIVTSRPVDTYDTTRESVRMHFGDIPLIHSTKKAILCTKLGIRTIIEDHPNTAIECAKLGIQCYLMDYPWNRNIPKGLNIVRVTGWADVVTCILQADCL